SRQSANSIKICCVHSGLRQSRGESSMIEMRRRQLSFGDGLIAEEICDLREDWMKHADEVLADEEIEKIVYEALAQRHPNSRRRGRRGTPADVAAAVDPQAHPQLELRGAGTRGAGQSGVPELYPHRQWQGPRCEDDGPLGRSARPAGAESNS